MRRLLIPILAAAVLAVSCGEAGGVRSDVPDLLRTVPSRSIVVMHFKDCEPALEMLLDSTSAFRAIDYGRYDDAEIVLSYDYGAKLIPLLSINTGRTQDTAGDVGSIMRQAAARKLFTLFSRDSLDGRSVLFISPSEASLGEVDSHLSARTSILEAPGFVNALELPRGSEGTIYLRNTAAARWLPKESLVNLMPRRKTVDFLSRACEWTVGAVQDDDMDAVMLNTEGDGDRYFMNVFASLQPSESRLAKVLPDSSEFVVDLPLKDWKAYYDARVKYLDAIAVLDKHQRALRSLKGSFGKDPLAWAAEQDFKEVATFSRDGRSILLLRPAKAKNLPSEPVEFAYPGFAAEVFGGVFSPGEEAFCCGREGWLAVGSADDLQAFLACDDHYGDFPSRDLKFAVLAEGWLVSGTSTGVQTVKK